MINISFLRYLGNLRHGAELYYSVLMNDCHEMLAIGAACKVIDLGLNIDQNLSKLIELSRYRAVRDKLLPVLFDSNPQEEMLTVLDQLVYTQIITYDDLIRAKINRNAEETYNCYCELFKLTGDYGKFEDALGVATHVTSISTAIEMAVINILFAPENGLWALALFDILVARDANEYLREFIAILDETGQYEALASIIRIRLALTDRRYDNAQQELVKLYAYDLPEVVQYQVDKLSAEFYEARSEYQTAYEYYKKQNLWGRSETYRAGAFFEHISRLNSIKFDLVPADTHTNYLIMLGFPRSGTTFLENIIDSHPYIRTLEEIGSNIEPDRILMRYRKNHPDMEIVPTELVLRMRSAYYSSLNVAGYSDPVEFVIDKMPIMSARATYLRNFFGNKRYIFSIRHPYDVVISCFKQGFAANLAMDCFTSFEESCRTYDFVMGIWFSNYDLTSKEVCYVRYDDLCTNFDQEVARVLNFIGVDWDTAVHNFAENAKMRAHKTPSYGKVKLGNTIGVQSSWKKYRFLFEKPEARVLDKWVEFFGYEGL